MRAPLAARSSPLLQRRCACGGVVGPSGECEACRARRLSRERSGSAAAGLEAAPAIVHDVLRSPGRPLDGVTRAALQPRFSHDLGRVRVHTDAEAGRSAAALGAVAYTVGRNVVFSEGAFAPSTPAGRSVLAHELTHVGQQDEAQHQPGATIAIGAVDSPLEREADAAARGVAGGGGEARPAGRILQRQPQPLPDVESRSQVGDVVLRVNDQGQVEFLYSAPKAPTLGSLGVGFRCKDGKCVAIGARDAFKIGSETYSVDDAAKKLGSIAGGGGAKTPGPLPSAPGGFGFGRPGYRACFPSQMTPAGLCCPPGERWSYLKGACAPEPAPGAAQPRLELGTEPPSFRRPRLPGFELPALELGLPRIEIIDHFSVDGEAVPAGAEDKLERLAGELRLVSGRIQVSGHTDRSHTAEYNLGLSERRARAVVQALVSRGVDASRIAAEGFGEREPLFPKEETEEQKARNRRVHVSYRVPLAPPMGVVPRPELKLPEAGR